MGDAAYLPILFQAAMVCAALGETKIQTRRVIKPDWWICLDPEDEDDRKRALPMCPYGVHGDRLYVRETWAAMDFLRDGVERDPPQCVGYRADRTARYFLDPDTAIDCDTERWNWDHSDLRWRPSIYMPRWASRLDLEVTAVHIEKVQEISDEDAIAEGITKSKLPGARCWIAGDLSAFLSPRDAFRALWNKINAKPKPVYGRVDGDRVITHYQSFPWEDIQETRTHRGKPWYVYGNPRVWVVGFKKVSKRKSHG